MPNAIRAATALTAVLSVAAAQTTWNVGGPAGLPQIRDALALAAPGDQVVVAPGTYAHFTDDVGVTIRAALPGTVDVELDAAAVPPSCTGLCPLLEASRLAPPAGRESHVVGLNFRNNIAQIGFFPVRHHVVATGRVSFDDCQILAASFDALDCDGEVHLQDTDVVVTGSSYSFKSAVRVLGGSLTAVDCMFLGGDSVAAGTPGYAVDLSFYAVLHGSGVYARGGLRAGGAPGTEAIRCAFGSRVWLADSVLAGGGGQCALDVGAGSVATARTSLIQGGAACPSATDVPSLPGVARAGPLSPGAPFQLTLQAAPNALLGVFGGPSLGAQPLPALLAQPAWLGLGLASPVALLPANSSGQAVVSWNIPYAPGFVGARLWFQAVAGPSLPLQASPVVGGVAR